MGVTGWGWACLRGPPVGTVLLSPLVGTILIAFTWRALPWRIHGMIGTIAIFAAFVFAIRTVIGLEDQPESQRQIVSVAWNYANTAGVDAQLSILVDPLSVFMMLVVSGVSALIHLYSVGYMASDRGYTRFFAYLN